MSSNAPIAKNQRFSKQNSPNYPLLPESGYSNVNKKLKTILISQSPLPCHYIIHYRRKKMTTPQNQPQPLEDILKFANRYSLGSEKGEGSKHFLRIKIPNGILTTQQFRKIADLSEKYGRKYAEITDRQDIQLHWIEAEDAPAIFGVLQGLGFTTDKCGQGYPGVGHGDVRNIEGCSVAGVDKDELIDTSPMAKELDQFFTGNKDFEDLPRKIKISISGCSLNCPAPEAYDLAFMATKKPSGKVGFIVFVGGTLGSSPHIAQQLKVWVEPELVVEFTKAVVEIFRDNGRREVKAKARFRWLVEEWGIDRLRSAIETKLGKKLEPYELERLSIRQAEHIGVNPQKQKGKVYINVPVLGGVLSTDIIRQIADLADTLARPRVWCGCAGRARGGRGGGGCPRSCRSRLCA